MYAGFRDEWNPPHQQKHPRPRLLISQKMPKGDPTQKNPPNESVVETTKTKSNNIMSKMFNYKSEPSKLTTRFHVRRVRGPNNPLK